MSQKKRVEKQKQRQSYLTRQKKPECHPANNSSGVNKYYIRTSKMTEPEIASLVNDACVYLGVGLSEVPPVAMLSTDHTATTEHLRLAFQEPPPSDKTIAVIRPGDSGLLTLDTLRTQALGRISVETCEIGDGVRILDRTQFIYSQPGYAPRRVVNGKSPLWTNFVENENYTEEEAGRYAAMSTAVTLLVCREKMWSANMSEGRASVGIISDPVALREMFKLRDKPEGKTRREALAHIVKGHWRQGANKSECRRFVESYIRGKTDFEWFGLETKISTNGVDM